MNTDSTTFKTSPNSSSINQPSSYYRNPFDQEYLSLVSEILEQGIYRLDRTKIGTIAIFGTQRKYDLRKGFPLLTTKKVHIKAIVHELIWFLSGSTNIRYLVQNDVKIWNEWAYECYLKANNLNKKYPRYSDSWYAHQLEFIEKIKSDKDFADLYGELGPVYGKQWVRWTDEQGREINQIQNVIEQIKADPTSRRIIVSSWNVGEIQQLINQTHSAPPPCHTLFQFSVCNDRLDLQLYQRSADVPLGVPFNIASYSLLLSMVAKECGLQPGIFIHTTGDTHIYLNQIEGIKQQLSAPHFPPPTLKIANKPFWELKYEDFHFENYQSAPPIKFPIAV